MAGSWHTFRRRDLSNHPARARGVAIPTLTASERAKLAALGYADP
jgi:hypothetical protein